MHLHYTSLLSGSMLEIAEALENAVAETLEDRVGVAFSGGIDSTLIAYVAKKYAEVELFAAGMPGSEDLGYAERVAECLGLPLHVKMLTEEDVLNHYGTAYSSSPGNLLRVELLVPACAVGEMAREKGLDVVLFGAGSEELFVGYERYYSYWNEGKNLDEILRREFSNLKNREIGQLKRLMRRYGLEARFPFYNRKLADKVFGIPLPQRMEERELKKGLLRDAACYLGVPEIAVKRKKRALQYGSGIHKVLLRNSRYIELNYPSPSL